MLDREVDITKAVIPKPGHYRASTKSIGDPRDIERLADILVDSERPAILYGQQVWAARGHEEAIALLRGLDIPGYFNGGSRGLLPPGDPHHFDRTRGNAFAEADVIVIVGTPFDFRMGYGKRISNKATLVQIDMDYRTVGKNRDISLGLVGDPGAILGAVLQAASGRLKNDKRQARQQWMKKLSAAEDAATEKLMPLFKSNNTPIHPYRVAYELNEFLADNTIYIGDGGDVVTISAQAVRPRRPGQWMDPGALGSLGVGTGFAIAAGLAHPSKEVLCYYGDGSFGMTAFDMETANRFGVPYIAVIGNNSAMNQIRYGQLAKYGEERGNVGNLLGDVPFGKFAEMLGGYGEEVRDPAQIAPALRRARESVREAEALGRHQHLGRPARVRAGHQEPDHVQVTGARRLEHGQGIGRRTHPRLHARAVRTDVHAAAGVVRRRRHQGGEGRCRRRHARAAARHSGRRQPLFHDAQPQQALDHARHQDAARQGGAREAGQALRRAGRELRARRPRPHGLHRKGFKGEEDSVHADSMTRNKMTRSELNWFHL